MNGYVTTFIYSEVALW